MHLDPDMPALVAGIFLVVALAALLKVARQPYVVAYLFAGVCIGPDGLGLVQDAAVIDRIGALGILLLLFFVGMEVSPRHFLANWKVPVIGTLLQIGASVVCAYGIGHWLAWPLPRVLLVGFVISLSSTAVIVKILEDRQQLDSRTGKDVLGVLLIQDILIVPMLILLELFSGKTISEGQLLKQGIGTVLVVAMVVALVVHRSWKLPFARRLRTDPELQVFVALGLCFGFALITGFFELSAALGAFVAGMYVGTVQETEWVHRSLHPFRVVFVSLFFLSIGMLVDLDFARTHGGAIGAVVVASLLTNTLLNAIVLRLLGERWSRCMYGASLLAPIGEFGFVLATMGRAAGIINEQGYQITITSIYLSLVLGAVWLSLSRRLFQSATD